MRRAGPRRVRPPAPGALVDAVRDRHLEGPNTSSSSVMTSGAGPCATNTPASSPSPRPRASAASFVPLDDGAHPRPGRLRLALVLLLGGGGPRSWRGPWLARARGAPSRRGSCEPNTLEGRVRERGARPRHSAPRRRSALQRVRAGPQLRVHQVLALEPCPRTSSLAAQLGPGVWRAPAGTASVARHRHVSRSWCPSRPDTPPGGAGWTGTSMERGRGAPGGGRGSPGARGGPRGPGRAALLQAPWPQTGLQGALGRFSGKAAHLVIGRDYSVRHPSHRVFLDSISLSNIVRRGSWGTPSVFRNS